MKGIEPNKTSRRAFIKASASVLGAGAVAGLTPSAHAGPDIDKEEGDKEKRIMSEPKIHKVTLTVISQKGTCAFGHKVGQEFEVGLGTPEGLCTGAYSSALQTIFALQVNGQIPWARPDGSVHIACPDPENPVVMAIRRESL